MHKHPHQQYDPEYNRNLMLAFAIICVLMGGWYYFYEIPHRHKLQEEQAKQRAEAIYKQEELAKLQNKNEPDAVKTAQVEKNIAEIKERPREEVLAASPRIKINTEKLHGSIDLKGARLDDITLAKYKETIAPHSKDSIMLSPVGSKSSSFIDLGWASESPAIVTPDSSTIWKAEGGDTLSPNNPVKLTWDNGQGFNFIITYSIDNNYLITAEQKIENKSGEKVTFYPYALISKAEPKTEKAPVGISHTGPMGVMDGTLKDIPYEELRKVPKEEFPDSTGWIGITEQYWAKALIPPHGEKYKANFRYTIQDAQEKFQVDYLGDGKTVNAGETITYSPRIFTGAKELKVLENYRDQYNIPLFERVIDFGWFHFLAKPLMKLMLFFNDHIHNIGLSILLLTFCVKLLLFPLARKSYISMGRMRDLNPKMLKIREQYKSDKMELNKKIMELYKTEKVNPASGCVPILLQIPIFFALIKVFTVSVEMRHTPFYGWIYDLSAPDHTSIFNLFGLIPLHLPEFLMIGAWPCIWAVTMYIQQKLTPMTNMDATQQKMMKLLPIFLVFAFSKVPAGLVIYYAFSNTLTIFQQLYFLKYHGQPVTGYGAPAG